MSEWERKYADLAHILKARDEEVAELKAVVALADSFILACPAIVAIRAFSVLPQGDRDRVDAAYSALWNAVLDHANKQPLEEQLARLGLPGEAQ